MTIVKNDLYDYYGLSIYQDEDNFKFSLDSILLAEFVDIDRKIDKIVDFCTGNAPVPLILSTKTENTIYGIELQESIANLAELSVKENNVEKQIKIIKDNIKNVDKHFSAESIDVITCNPPYFKTNDYTKQNVSKYKSIARHELNLNLDQLCIIARKLLRNNGYLSIVHRTNRLIEIIEAMKKNNIEPKKIQFIYPKKNQDSNLVLIEGTKNGKSGLKILPPLLVHNEDGSYSSSINKIFYGKENE